MLLCVFLFSLLLTCCMCPCCRAELQQTGEELLSAFSVANSALEYIPPVDVNGITVKSAAAKTKGVLNLRQACNCNNHNYIFASCSQVLLAFYALEASERSDNAQCQLFLLFLILPLLMSHQSAAYAWGWERAYGCLRASRHAPQHVNTPKNHPKNQHPKNGAAMQLALISSGCCHFGRCTVTLTILFIGFDSS